MLVTMLIINREQRFIFRGKILKNFALILQQYAYPTSELAVNKREKCLFYAITLLASTAPLKTHYNKDTAKDSKERQKCPSTSSTPCAAAISRLAVCFDVSNVLLQPETDGRRVSTFGSN